MKRVASLTPVDEMSGQAPAMPTSVEGDLAGRIAELSPNSPKIACIDIKSRVERNGTPLANWKRASEQIAILDCGAQYGKVIDRRVRNLNIESIMLPLSTSANQLKEAGYKAIIISGGPSSVNDNTALEYDPAIFEIGVPILGICYGFQMINKQFGGEIYHDKFFRLDGQCNAIVNTQCRIFNGLDKKQKCLMTHGDRIKVIAKGFEQIACCENIIAGIANEELDIYGLQFHPEVDLTNNGLIMLKNFLIDIAGCAGDYHMQNREEAVLDEIRRTVGPSQKVLVLVSGGVDSTVCAALLHKALKNGDQNDVTINGVGLGENASTSKQSINNHHSGTALNHNGATASKAGESALNPISNCHSKHERNIRDYISDDEASPDEGIELGENAFMGCESSEQILKFRQMYAKERVIAVHVDNGFMRYNESLDVEQSLREIGLNPIVYRACSSFLTASHTHTRRDQRGNFEIVEEYLCQTVDPEIKRRIIGDTFIAIHDSLLNKLGLSENDVLLAQGTLRPDLIESASSIASGHADVIKTHHNDTALVRKLREQRRVIEPLKDFHKDEVRQLGRDLGLPAKIVERHPFPGPGLSIRILCAKAPFQCPDYAINQTNIKRIVNFAELCMVELDLRSHFERLISTETCDTLQHITASKQFDGHILPVRSVGVQGDKRSYSYVAILWSRDNAAIDWHNMDFIAGLITKLLHRVNRVAVVLNDPAPEKRIMAERMSSYGDDEEVNALVFDQTNRHTETFEKNSPDGNEIAKFNERSMRRVVAFRHNEVHDVTPTTLTLDNIETLRFADHLASSCLLKRPKVARRIAQMPIIMLPVHLKRLMRMNMHLLSPSVQRTICLRPFVTTDFMTGRAALPGTEDMPLDLLDEMVDAILTNAHNISAVLYDLTAKPPGTTEWE